VSLRRAYVGLGGNVGDVAATLEAACIELGLLAGTRVVACSPLYRTPAWGGIEQPDFLNAVAALDTTLDPPALLAGLLRIERAHGRDRDRETRWGPRTLDLDLLLHGSGPWHGPGLDVPHPRMAERTFVLVPLLDVAPDVVIPGVGRGADALAALGSVDIARVDAGRVG